MKRFYYADAISNFHGAREEEILGHLSAKNEFSTEQTQVFDSIWELHVRRKNKCQMEVGKGSC